MNLEDALTILDTILQTERLKDVQELVFRQSWNGKTYQEIAEETGYSAEHIRDVGFRLWQLLSDALGEKVTKSNIHAILRQRSHRSSLAASDNPPVRRYDDRVALAEKRVQDPILLFNNAEPEPLISDQGPIATSPSSTTSVDFPGTPLAQNSPFYVERPPIEQRCYQEILQEGSLIRIKAPRKMGKTSLLNRILHDAMVHGYARVRLNLQQADQEALSDINAFLRWFCKSITWKLNLEPNLDAYWDQDIGLAKSSCTRYFEDYLLPQIGVPLVLALDEVDRIFAYPQLAQDFLPLLRIWHEEANESDVWRRLRLVVMHSTEVYVPLNVNQSPFNVGLPIRLTHWHAEQVDDLAQRYGLEWDQGSTAQLMALTSGHPYLVQLAFHYLWGGEGSWSQLLKDAPTEAGIYGTYLRQQLEILQASSVLSAALKEVIESDRPVLLEPAIAHQLQSMGLVQFSGSAVMPSCQLYCQYFRMRL